MGYMVEVLVVQVVSGVAVRCPVPWFMMLEMSHSTNIKSSRTVLSGAEERLYRMIEELHTENKIRPCIHYRK